MSSQHVRAIVVEPNPQVVGPATWDYTLAVEMPDGGPTIEVPGIIPHDDRPPVDVVDARSNGVGTVVFGTYDPELGFQFTFHERDNVAECEQTVEATYTPVGTAFPTDPLDGELFVRTDLEAPNVFTFDAGRDSGAGRWLAQVEWIDHGYNATPASPSTLRTSFNDAQPNTTRGWRFPYDVCVIGAAGKSVNNWTGTMQLRRGTVNLAGVLTFTAQSEQSDDTFDDIITAGSHGALGVRMTYSSGTSGVVTCRTYVRRVET